MKRADDLRLSELERHLLQHTLGVRGPRSRWCHRNHFACDVGSADFPTLESLRERGLMYRRELDANLVYHATEAGCRALGLGARLIQRARREVVA